MNAKDAENAEKLRKLDSLNEDHCPWYVRNGGSCEGCLTNLDELGLCPFKRFTRPFDAKEAATGKAKLMETAEEMNRRGIGVVKATPPNEIIGYVLKSHHDGALFMGGNHWGKGFEPTKAARFSEEYYASSQILALVGRKRDYYDRYLPHVHPLFADGTLGAALDETPANALKRGK